MAAMRAEAEPPPGAGVREPRSSTKPRTLRPRGARPRASRIMYSMIRFSGTKGETEREAQALDHEADLLPLVEDEEALLRDVVLGGHQHRLEGDEAHELRAGHGELQRPRFLHARLEGHVGRRHLVVVEVHRHLRHPVLLDPPADGPHRLEPPRLPCAAPLLPHVEGDAVGLLLRPEDVDVVGDQEVAGAGARWPPRRARTRPGPKSGSHSGRRIFSASPSYSPGADLLEASGGAALRRRPVEVDGDPELRRRRGARTRSRSATQSSMRDARHRHEGAHVHGAHAGVLALVPAHVDAVPGRRGPRRARPRPRPPGMPTKV